MTTRRKFLGAGCAGLCVLAMPLTPFAQQQGKVWRVGVLVHRSRPKSLDSDAFGAFVRGMRELGYVEGKNLVIEWRFADGKAERLPELAAELVRLKVDVILSTSTTTTHVIQKATTSIPVVMGTIADPVGSGFVKSLARPGGNITGLTNVLVDISAKHLEMLLGIAPKLSRAAVLVNPDNSSNIETVKSLQAAAQKTGIKVFSVEARTAENIGSAFSLITREHVGAVILAQDGLFIEHRHQVAELLTRHRLPSIAAIREFAEAGVLMTYGPSFPEIYRRAATYVDKIFKGARPADLPVEQPTKIELFINNKTAKALGLAIPQSLLISADKVIE